MLTTFCDGSCSDVIDVPIECECLGPLLPAPTPTLRHQWERVLRRHAPRWTAGRRWLPWWLKRPPLSLSVVDGIIKDIYLPSIIEQLNAPCLFLELGRRADP